jgi:Ca2+-binding RTX toxin-like protein
MCSPLGATGRTVRRVLNPMKAQRIGLIMGATALLTAASAFTASGAPAAAAMCQGVPATVVGTPGMTQLTGTGGGDVVVTGGARNVATFGGGDLVCVTGQTVQVTSGAGNDRVFTGDLPVQTNIALEAGTDQFVGGARSDRVASGSGVDQVDTGDGADDYFDDADSLGGAVNSDRVHLGPGPDSAFVEHPNLDGVLDGGAGFNTLAPGACCEFGITLVVDNGTETATLDGEPRYQWDGFRGFGFGAFSVDGAFIVFNGTDAAERVGVGQEFEFGPHIELLNMRGGDDRVGLDGVVGPVLAGDGNDSLQLDGFADERAPSSLHPKVSLDLGVGTMQLGEGAAPILDLTDVENVDVSEFVTVVVRGDAQANNVVVGRACLTRTYGLGGPDSLRARPEQGCSKRYTVPHSVRADGGPGNDLLLGRQTRDRLIGGLGTDAADGRLEVDTCEAEIQQRCER